MTGRGRRHFRFGKGSEWRDEQSPGQADRQRHRRGGGRRRGDAPLAAAVAGSRPLRHRGVRGDSGKSPRRAAGSRSEGRPSEGPSSRRTPGTASVPRRDLGRDGGRGEAAAGDAFANLGPGRSTPADTTTGCPCRPADAPCQGQPVVVSAQSRRDRRGKLGRGARSAIRRPGCKVARPGRRHSTTAILRRCGEGVKGKGPSRPDSGFLSARAAPAGRAGAAARRGPGRPPPGTTAAASAGPPPLPQ